MSWEPRVRSQHACLQPGCALGLRTLSGVGRTRQPSLPPAAPQAAALTVSKADPLKEADQAKQRIKSVRIL